MHDPRHAGPKELPASKPVSDQRLIEELFAKVSKAAGHDK